jgi:para-nitrobenzyl esterase
VKVFAEGKQKKVPLLVGWNSEEMNYRMVMGPADPTLENFQNALKRLYPKTWEEASKAYAAASDADVVQVATDLASDRFISFSTWKWADSQNKHSSNPVYRYYYAHPRPAMKPEMGNATPGLAGGVNRNAGSNPPAPPARGAVHSAEIEYAMGNLRLNNVYAWTPDDFKVSELMQSYFANFIKTGNPNTKGLPEWPAMSKTATPSFMRLDVNASAEPERNGDRYVFLEANANKK